MEKLSNTTFFTTKHFRLLRKGGIFLTQCDFSAQVGGQETKEKCIAKQTINRSKDLCWFSSLLSFFLPVSLRHYVGYLLCLVRLFFLSIMNHHCRQPSTEWESCHPPSFAIGSFCFGQVKHFPLNILYIPPCPLTV